jgi:hypothetical protein
MKIFLNTQSITPETAAVRGPTSLTPVPFPAITAGNKLRYEVFLVDGFGGYDPISGDGDYTLKLAIGDVETSRILCTVPPNGWTSQTVTVDGVPTSCWTGILDVSVDDVIEYVQGLRSRQAFWELQITGPDNTVTTYAQQPVEVLNSLQ